jgi:hypothetical protein
MAYAHARAEVMWEEVKSIKCKKCKKELTYFKAYIPNLGEVCMNCYIEYAQEMERQGE